MGAGKTTVGKKLARLMRMDFIDTDHLLEKKTGVSVSHIFEVEGESGFRDRETRVLEEVSNGSPAVISTGGGAILRPENRMLMRKSGRVVYLRASCDLLWDRLKGCQNRPLLQTGQPRQVIDQLHKDRDPLYASEADVIVDVSTDSAYRTAQKILRKMKPDEQKVAN